MFVLMSNFLYFSLKLVFKSDYLSDLKTSTIMYLETVPLIVFIIDMIFNFNTSFYESGILMEKRKDICIRYLTN